MAVALTEVEAILAVGLAVAGLAEELGGELMVASDHEVVGRHTLLVIVDDCGLEGLVADAAQAVLEVVADRRAPRAPRAGDQVQRSVMVEDLAGLGEVGRAPGGRGALLFTAQRADNPLDGEVQEQVEVRVAIGQVGERLEVQVEALRVGVKDDESIARDLRADEIQDLLTVGIALAHMHTERRLR